MKLSNLTNHYELHVLKDPEGEVEESYDFFDWTDGVQEFEKLDAPGVYLDLIEVDPDGFPVVYGKSKTNY